LPQDARITGFGAPHSYRGYYTDLSFEPSDTVLSVVELLAVARGCMGVVFEGYKGGDYVMGALTPVWLSHYGSADGPRLMSLDTTTDPITPVCEHER
jgi:hypothetical protein